MNSITGIKNLNGHLIRLGRYEPVRGRFCDQLFIQEKPDSAVGKIFFNPDFILLLRISELGIHSGPGFLNTLKNIVADMYMPFLPDQCFDRIYFLNIDSQILLLIEYSHMVNEIIKDEIQTSLSLAGMIPFHGANSFTPIIFNDDR